MLFSLVPNEHLWTHLWSIEIFCVVHDVRGDGALAQGSWYCPIILLGLVHLDNSSVSKVNSIIVLLLIITLWNFRPIIWRYYELDVFTQPPSLYNFFFKLFMCKFSFLSNQIIFVFFSLINNFPLMASLKHLFQFTFGSTVKKKAI